MDKKYIPLYRKYRPQTFHDLTGQENIVRAFSNAIELNRISHAYLLCGPRGTGKTSSARILAKSLNCVEGPTLTPCGKCPACLDVINSSSVDVIEIDAASNRSVEDAQAILEKIQYVPVNGRYKIYIIDEVHMLSKHAFNALLKTLEEPPENVIFILATTEPHKVIDTVISRCQRFDFRRITTEDTVKRLRIISEKETINITKEALYAIAKNSQGGLRDALALLDQISVAGINKKIETDDINEILGRISYDVLSEITDYIISSDCTQAVPLIDKIYSKGNEPVQIVDNLIQYFRDLMILRNCTDKELIYNLTQINETNYDTTKIQAGKFSLQEIIQITDKLSYYAERIKDTTNKYLWLELCIMDLTNYKNLPSAENLLQRIEALEALSANEGAALKKNETFKISEIKPIKPLKEENEVQPEIADKAAPVPCSEDKDEKNLEPSRRKKTEKENSVNSDINKLWVSILQNIDSPPNKAFYSNLAQPVEISESKVVIAFSKEMFVKQAKEGSKKQALFDAVSKYLAVESPDIEIIIGDNINLTKKTSFKPVSEKKTTEEETIIKQEEEAYQKYMENKTEEQNSVSSSSVDNSSQAAMIKDLFCGKFIN